MKILRFFNRNKSRRPPPTVRRILAEAGALVAIHFLLLHALARANVLHHLLSPGPDAMVALAITASFLLLRIFLLVFGLGWLAARLWLCWSRPSVEAAPE